MDETIALEEGVIGQTTGVGGFLYAQFVHSVLLEYCELIKVCSNVDLRFTNPSGLVTQALRSAGYNIVGICDAPSSTKFRMAKELGVEEGFIC